MPPIFLEKIMIHRALKLLRTYHQLKQNELASRLGISNSYLSEIECGNKPPTLELLQVYSTVFKIPVSSILLFSEQTLDEGNPSSRSKLRIASADKILKILEWIDEKNALNS
jgi:transcriptional regulator with XRE-family HTH domain